MKEKWNQRYSQKEYAYGEEPNNYLKEQIKKFPTGKILFPADGEGRNSVYAASLGWEAFAYDISPAGKEKALQLAKKKNVTLHYEVGELVSINYQQGQFDALALIYAHFPAAHKSPLHRSLATYLRPGGIVIFEAFSKKHQEYSSRNQKVGGPKELADLFSIEEIQADFAGFEIIELKEQEIELNEGLFHIGTGSVIRFTGAKE